MKKLENTRPLKALENTTKYRQILQREYLKYNNQEYNDSEKYHNTIKQEIKYGKRNKIC